MKDILVRKINELGLSSNNFKYPMKVGEWVEAPDWNPEKKCGGGLHGLLNFKGDWGFFEGSLWMVITNLEGLVIIDDEKVKIRKGKIDYIGEEDGLYEKYKEYVELFDNECVYLWARFIGNKDIMINKIKEPEWAFKWAYNLGDRDIMIDRVVDSEWAYEWACYIGDRDIMIDRIVEPEWAYNWACYLGNKDIMIDRVTDSEWAYEWFHFIGDKDIMIKRITGELKLLLEKRWKLEDKLT